MSSYDPNSLDSKLTVVLTRLDHQDAASLLHRAEMKEFMTEMRAVNAAHVAKFEAADREKWYQRGFVAAITMAISAFWAWVTHKTVA